MRRRVFRVIFAAALLGLTSGCETISGLLDDLFGPAPSEPAPAEAVPAPQLADRIVVLKSKRTLELVHAGEVFETFPIALGREPRDPKQQEGDGRTPEGIYRIDWRTTDTRYTRELHISYPEEEDRARAKAKHVSPGGAIFIHGLPGEYGTIDPPFDWTEGCISVGNAAIVKIWDAAPDGTPIAIFP